MGSSGVESIIRMVRLIISTSLLRRTNFLLFGCLTVDKTMIDTKWIAMNDLQDAFNEITHFDFLIDKLQDAVNNGNQNAVVDIAAAMTAFYPIYLSNWDEKFKTAWDTTIGKPDELINLD
jgi:hypothetical protein